MSYEKGQNTSDFLDNYSIFPDTQLIIVKKSRIGWIDIARGIGILLVVYGHALSAGEMRALIYSFHMPLFFLLSGLVFTYKSAESFHAFLRKNVRNILLPYMVFALLSFLYWYFTKQPSVDAALFQFGSIFYGNGNNNLLQFNNILWFLPCLFVTRVGFFLITRYKHDVRFISIALLGISIIGYIYSLFFSSIKLPFGLETSLDALVFFGVGYLLMKQKHSYMPHYTQWKLFILPLLFCIWIIFAQLNFQSYGVQIDLRKDVLNNYVYFYLAALAGSLATVQLSMFIAKNNVLEYLGKQSLVIFAWHLLAFPYVSKLLSLLQIKPLLAEIPSFISPIVWSMTSILLVLVIAVPLQYILKRTKHFF